VHNLYRNNWHQVINYRDNLAQDRPPEQWAIDFGEAFKNVVTQNTGPALRRGMARLMQHPQYRDAVSPMSALNDSALTRSLAARNRRPLHVGLVRRRCRWIDRGCGKAKLRRCRDVGVVEHA
jgi:hypothetical protein